MKRKCSVLILGTSYGSLLATKLLLAGHGAATVDEIVAPVNDKLEGNRKAT